MNTLRAINFEVAADRQFRSPSEIEQDFIRQSGQRELSPMAEECLYSLELVGTTGTESRDSSRDTSIERRDNISLLG